MGLDMYLRGHKYHEQEENKTEDGFRVNYSIIRLGYWRKHPNLHGFIVKTFAGGKDECQEISLTKESMLTIIGAIKENLLPHTEGFFFGKSLTGTESQDIEIFLEAIKWLEADKLNRTVIYEASW